MSALITKLETLAIHGGTPVREKLLPYARQSLDDADIEAVVEVLKSDWLTTGPKVREFEEQFAARVGAEHAVSFSSGTAALHGAAFAAGLASGDEAVTTPMTFCATANCVLYQGATPVFADVSADTLNLDPSEVAKKINSRTKAIIAVDYAGHPAALDELGELSRNHQLLLIEDASHALGAEYQGKRVGSVADMTTFSFHPVKHLTTGEGGMVATNDPRLAETLRRFRNHGISSEARDRQDAGQWFYEMVLLGFNYRLTDIACALGISQLEKLPANLARRREIAAQYATAFRDLPGISTPVVREGVNPAWHLYPIRLELENLATDRAEIFRALRAENLGVNVHYIPVHRHPYYRESFRSGEKYPVAEDAYERLISLPMFHSMTPQDVDDVIHAMRKVMNFFHVPLPDDGKSGRTPARERSKISSMSTVSDWVGYRALVIGCGSIGRRHARNLKSLGVQELGFCDASPEALKQCCDELNGEAFSDYEQALQVFRPDLVLICTPPVYHVEAALAALRARAHVFIEKPLSHESEGIQALISEARRRDRNVQIGYNMRFHPGLRIMKDLIDSGKIGRVLWLSAEVGQYLPDWRPWQNYRESYSARNEQGGGIILDGSHELDYIYWLLGRPTELTCRAEHLSSLDVDVEDSAWIYMSFPERRRAELHLDFVQRSYTRTCKIVGETGTALWDFNVPEVRWFSSDQTGWNAIPYTFESNDMYLAEMRHFLESLGTETGPMIDLDQGRDVILLVEAAKKSSEEGRPQVLNWTRETIDGPVVAIIQARMGSSRLPGKSLAVIEGRTMLWHVIQRAKRASLVDKVVVATSTSPTDDVIAQMCLEEGVPCHRGSEADVLDRFYTAARAEKAAHVVRITADCPLLDPEVIDRVVRRFLRGDVDYASNAMVRSYPDGLDTEVFSFSALETAWHEAVKPSEREHVTPYLRSDKFRTANVENHSTSSYQHYRWTVDETEDLEFIRAVYKAFRGNDAFGMKDVLQLLEKTPALEKMNSAIVSNRGYYKSLFEDAKAMAAPPRPIEKSKMWIERACKVIPGASQTFSKGANQHVRGVAPMFLVKGNGCRVWDVDGNEYIDYIQALLPNILGYAHSGVNAAVGQQLQSGHSFSLPHPIEVELAERLTQLIPCAEMVRFGKNGSDATTGAVRAARAATGRDRIACCGYHGWQDWYIGSTTRNAGVPQAVRDLTHPFAYNDLGSLQRIFDDHKGEFAAVIMEPVNFVPPAPGFLEDVRDIAHQNGAVLIFDEICTGFHFGLGGAQKKFRVTPDLACFGKAMGNGFPISCVVGKADVMKVFEDIFFSFTFAGEVSSMAAAMKVLDVLETTDALARMDANGRILQEGLNTLAKEAGLQDRIQCVGYPVWSLIRFFDAEGKDSLLVRSLFAQECVKRGVLFLATHNVTTAHDPLAIEHTLRVYADVCKTLGKWLSEKHPEQYLEGAAIQPVFKVR